MHARYTIFNKLPEGMIADDYFDAIRSGNIDLVRHWFTVRLQDWRALEEAALDFAEDHGNDGITALIREHLEKKPAPQRKNPASKLYRRIWRSFSRNHYYSDLMLETYIDGAIDFRICYKTKEQAPYLRDQLTELGPNEFVYNFCFSFNLHELSEETILDKINKVFNILTSLKTKDGTDIHSETLTPYIQEINNFFNDVRKNIFSNPDDGCPRPKHQTNTYIDYAMYKAAINFNDIEMWKLLRCGANPNARFDNRTILLQAVSLGSVNALKSDNELVIEKNVNKLLQTLKILLLYGANPMIETFGQTIMEYLVQYSAYVKPNMKELYLKIIQLITVHNHSVPHILVHPSIPPSPCSTSIEKANEVMTQKKKYVPYVSRVKIIATKIPTILLTMTNNAEVTVESYKIKHLSNKLYQALFEFFTQRKEISIKGNPRTYFDCLMSSDEGTGFVEIIKHDGELAGFIISEVKYTKIDDKTASIYYAKLALASKPLSPYPGLMKALLALRGIAHKDYHCNDNNFSYYEALTARGFAMTDNVKRFPELPVLTNQMRQIIDAVYVGMKVRIELINDCFYVSDGMDVSDQEKNLDNNRNNLAAFFRQIYRDKYYQPGYGLVIAFTNNDENATLFKESITPLLGEKAYDALLTFYSRQVTCDHENNFTLSRM